MRRLALHTALSFAVAAAPFVAMAQSSDSHMWQAPWVQDSLGPWRPDSVRVWCVTQYADFGNLFVIARVARPDSLNGCTDPAGGTYPLVIDLPKCPGQLDLVASPFALVRCTEHEWRRFPKKRAPAART